MTYGLELAGERRRRNLDRAVEEGLQAAALWEEMKDRLDEPAHAMSGGQQTAVPGAGAGQQPEVILLDEPTSGLDPISTAKVEICDQEEIHDHHRPAQVQQAARLADWAGFFYQGELVEWGEGKNLFVSPKVKTEDMSRPVWIAVS